MSRTKAKLHRWYLAKLICSGVLAGPLEDIPFSMELEQMDYEVGLVPPISRGLNTRGKFFSDQ